MKTETSQQTAIRAAAVQMDITLGDIPNNLGRILERLEESARNGAQLVVFPEAALSGYCFESLDDARPFCLKRDDAVWREISSKAAALGLSVVIGFLEAQDSGIYNSAFLYAQCANGTGQDTYQKTHLPVLGVDRFVHRGKQLPSWRTRWGAIGVLICYDIRFPEAARVLALNGVDVIVLPTNWPEGAESSPEFLTRARAWENRVFIVAANRVGVERGRRFIGRSQIVDPNGRILQEAGPDEETILYADLDLTQARQKRIVIEPGEWELDVIGGRRPDLYGPLVA